MKLPRLFKALSIAVFIACLIAPLTGPDGQSVTNLNNVVIVLDASGSMNTRMPGNNQRKMDAAKSALLQVLKQVPMDTQIGLLVFSGANVPNDWVYPLGPRDNEKLRAAIKRPLPKGGTPLGAYIKTGADRLLRQRAAQHGYGTYRLLIVTDGEAGDKDLVEQHVPEVLARGITVDVIGVAMKKTHTLATKVHSYRPANDPKSLRKAIEEVFAEVGQTDTDGAIEDAFALLEPIPVDLAANMLKALSSSGNRPIGTGPSAARRRATNQGQASPSVRSVGMGIFCFAIFALIFAAILRKLGRR